MATCIYVILIIIGIIIIIRVVGFFVNLNYNVMDNQSKVQKILEELSKLQGTVDAEQAEIKAAVTKLEEVNSDLEAMVQQLKDQLANVGDDLISDDAFSAILNKINSIKTDLESTIVPEQEPYYGLNS